MKKLVTMLLVLISVAAFATDSMMPTIHSTIMLDANFYNGENSNDGTYDNSNRFQVRKAAISVEGLVGERMNYALELGLSTCVGSGNQLKLMEAELKYELIEDLLIGIQQGHILSGFTGTTECSARLTLEKPAFIPSFGNCHPLGFIITKYHELGLNMDIEAELAIVNGSGGTLEGENEYNFGLILGTPFSGLSLSGAYNHSKRSYYNQSYESYSRAGFRMISGFEYISRGLWLTGEYYYGEGFTRDDQEMEAWYLQAGYEIPTSIKGLNTIQPYLKYEFWDRDKGSSNSEEQVLVEVGMNFKLSPYTMIRTAYRQIDIDSVSTPAKPSALIVRLQTNF